jgi:hypothetical protein
MVTSGVLALTSRSLARAGRSGMNTVSGNEIARAKKGSVLIIWQGYDMRLKIQAGMTARANLFVPHMAEIVK